MGNVFIVLLPTPLTHLLIQCRFADAGPTLPQGNGEIKSQKFLFTRKKVSRYHCRREGTSQMEKGLMHGSSSGLLVQKPLRNNAKLLLGKMLNSSALNLKQKGKAPSTPAAIYKLIQIRRFTGTGQLSH